MRTTILVLTLAAIVGASCYRATSTEDAAPKAAIRLTATPEQAFAGADIEVVVTVMPHPAARAVWLAVDGGEGFYSASSFEVFPNVSTVRRFTLRHKLGREGDGLIIVSATLHGDMGPLTFVERHIYRRIE